MRAMQILGAIALLVVALAACARTQPAAPAGGGETYTVRGVVAALPADGRGDLTLRHEALPDFVDRGGERVGMDAMTMPFPLAAEVALAGIAVGDPVECTLRVDWEAERPVELIAVRELPAGTRLAI
jgi:Cu/Ag efflux protein CusF